MQEAAGYRTDAGPRAPPPVLTKGTIIDESLKELVAIGASVGAHCQPCLDHHIRSAMALGIAVADIREAIAIGHTVEKGAMAAMRKYSAAAAEDLPAIAESAAQADKTPVPSTARSAGEKVLRIFDPAMCCSTGVCGPGVDPVLARFAGSLAGLEQSPGVRIERFNLGQQPQAFAEDAEVRALLADAGEQRLPFIFVDGRLRFQGLYPDREELLAALELPDPAESSFPTAAPDAGPCCGDGAGDGGCCG